MQGSQNNSEAYNFEPQHQDLGGDFNFYPSSDRYYENANLDDNAIPEAQDAGNDFSEYLMKEKELQDLGNLRVTTLENIIEEKSLTIIE